MHFQWTTKSLSFMLPPIHLHSRFVGYILKPLYVLSCHLLSSVSVVDWPVIINANDGLITANQVLTNQCEACKARSCKKPSLENFLLLSVQPELNIQLLAIPGLRFLFL